jgi:hypothetical protein
MSHGVHITKGKNKKRGVEDNFTMFGGDKLLERGEEIQNSQDYQKSNEPNVDGYLTGMAIGISVLFILNKF